jgi:poly-gamma-glutamate capsule biosynthesis protein CapA/YwtB (metallophosphatase superfamily)
MATYDSEAGDFTATLSGDAMLTRRLAVYDEPEFIALADLFRKSDVGFCNLESTVRNWDEGVPSITMGTYSTMAPKLIEDFKWFGLNLVSTANNHAFDYGEGGVNATCKHLDDAGFAHAGTGANMAHARAPGYLETKNGRVGLVAATSAFRAWNRAATQRPDMVGRAGVNPMAFKHNYTVDSRCFEELVRLSEELGFAKQRERDKTHFYSDKEIGSDSAEDVKVFGTVVTRGQNFSSDTSVDADDLAANLRQIKEARAQADWVIFSLHYHEFGGKALKTATTKTGIEEPASFVRDVAHAAIDAGADIVAGHGAHFALGIEIYKGKPIFYSLGNFIFQNDTVPYFPADAYERFDLDLYAQPSDFINARTNGGKKGHVAHAGFWENIAAKCVFRKGKLSEIRVHPVVQGFGTPSPQRGRPVLAKKGETGTKILDRMARLSKLYGTQMKVGDNVGVIKVNGKGK